MHKHRHRRDGTMRESDNWQKGIPFDAYIKSGFRHFMDWWSEHRGLPTSEGLEEALCALIFNASGYLHETLRLRYDESSNSVNEPKGQEHGSETVSNGGGVPPREEPGVGGTLAGGHSGRGAGQALQAQPGLRDPTGFPY